MWNIIKKASEYIAPTLQIDPIEDIDEKINKSKEILEKIENRENYPLSYTLESIKDRLIEEIDADDVQCFNYMTQKEFPVYLVDKFGEDISKDCITAVIRFFISFINTKLNKYYAHVSIHRPFSKLVGKMTDVIQIAPSDVFDMISEIWSQAEKSPIVLEMIVLDDGKKSVYPLIEFFCSTALRLDDIGEVSRGALSVILTKFKDEGKVQKTVIDGTFSILMPIINEYICDLFNCLPTIQFKGSYFSILEWIDDIYETAPGLDTEMIAQRINSIEQPFSLLSYAFLLSTLSNTLFTNFAVKALTDKKNLDLIIEFLKSQDEVLNRSALTILKTMLFTNDLRGLVIHSQETQRSADFLSALPPLWLVNTNDSLSLDSYESDALCRILMFSDCSKGVNEEFSKEVFSSLLQLLSRFKNIHLQTILSLTEVITLLASADISYFNSQLVDEYVSVVALYKDNSALIMSEDQNFKDNDNTRILAITEFGKELYTTYTAHERIDLINRD